MTKFSDIAVKFLHARGFEPKLCSNEDEAREKVTEFSKQKKWPCLFTKTTTSGEKSNTIASSSWGELNRCKMQRSSISAILVEKDWLRSGNATECPPFIKCLAKLLPK